MTGGMNIAKPCSVVLIISFFLCFFIALLPHISGIWRQNNYEDKKQGNRPPHIKKKSQLRPHVQAMSTMKFQIQTEDDNRTNEEMSHAKEEEQTARLSTLRSTCKVTKHNYDVILRPPNNLYVDRQHKLLYCNIPKVASTNWKRVLLVLSGKMKTTVSKDQWYINTVGKHQLTLFKDLSLQDRHVVMDTYIKFLFVRHPFSRVLSAFKNKLDPNSTFDRAVFWQNGLGRFIIRKYRNQNKPQLDNQTQHKYDLTFGEFIKFLIDGRTNRNEQNIHWREMYKMCLPCDIPYTFIGKFETLASDADDLLTLAKANHNVQFPPPSSSSPTNSSDDSMLNEYFHDIPRRDIEALYRRYQLDFRLFGYKLPKSMII